MSRSLRTLTALASTAWLVASCGRIGFELTNGASVDDPGSGNGGASVADDAAAGASAAGGARSDAGGTSSAGGTTPGDGGVRTSSGGTQPDAGAGGSPGVAGADAGTEPDATVDPGPFPRCTIAETWATTFDVDPTLAVSDAAPPRWHVRGGSAFPAGELTGGVWRSSNLVPLDTAPLNDFSTRVLLDVRMRNVVAPPTPNHGAILWINVNEGSTKFSAVYLDLQLVPGGGQTLVVFGKSDGATDVPLTTITGLPEAFVDVHLDVDPVARTVGVWIGTDSKGTFSFPETALPNGDQYATVASWSGTSEFDSVRVERCAP